MCNIIIFSQYTSIIAYFICNLNIKTDVNITMQMGKVFADSVLL